LTVDDIPYNPPRPVGEECLASRLTLHHFIGVPLLSRALDHVAPHNSDARQPQGTGEWPPAIILDVVYAAAALHAWGPQTFIKYVRETSGGAYNNDGEENDIASDDNTPGGPHFPDVQMTDQSTGHAERYHFRSRNQTRAVHHTGQSKKERFSDLWMQSSRKGQPRVEGARASDLARNEDVKL
jgi:hypothetical protein